LILSTILGFLRNYFIPENNVDLIKNDRIIGVVTDGTFTIPNFMTEPQQVNTEFVKYYFEDSKVTIVDARDKEQYDNLHIKGSVNIPYNYYEDYDILYELSDLSPEDIYIVYCNGGDCSLSLDLAYVMYDEFDFETVFVYEEGLPVWEEHNYPLSSNNEGEQVVDNNDKPNSLWRLAGIFCFLVIYLTFVIKTIRDKSKTKKEILNTILVVSFRLILGYIFIYASISKIANPLEFSNQIDQYKATPIIFNNLIALIIPWLELLIGLCLIFNRNLKGAIILSIFLLIVFIILLSQAYYRGISLECGCFGLGPQKTEAELSLEMIKRIKEDIVFLCMSLYLYFIYFINTEKYEK